MKVSNIEWKKSLSVRLLQFSVMVIKIANAFPKTAAGYVIATQIIKSATSVGANFAEAQDASSMKDFIQKLSISLREARETEYWLQVLSVSGLIKDSDIEVILKETQEIIAILTATVKSSKSKLI